MGSPLGIPQTQPGLGTQLVAVRAQEVDLVLCECGHRYGFHPMWWRQAASGGRRRKAAKLNGDCNLIWGKVVPALRGKLLKISPSLANAALGAGGQVVVASADPLGARMTRQMGVQFQLIAQINRAGLGAPESNGSTWSALGEWPERHGK